MPEDVTAADLDAIEAKIASIPPIGYLTAALMGSVRDGETVARAIAELQTVDVPRLVAAVRALQAERDGLRATLRLLHPHGVILCPTCEGRGWTDTPMVACTECGGTNLDQAATRALQAALAGDAEYVLVPPPAPTETVRLRFIEGGYLGPPEDIDYEP